MRWHEFLHDRILEDSRRQNALREHEIVECALIKVIAETEFGLRTQRLHLAKRLIDETGLPLNQVAIAAGFGSVRRFNDAFRNSYKRAPGELRRRGAGDRPQGSRLGAGSSPPVRT